MKKIDVNYSSKKRRSDCDCIKPRPPEERPRVYECGNCCTAAKENCIYGEMSLVENLAPNEVIELEAFYLIGAEIRRPNLQSGMDRFTADVERARALWNIDMRIHEIGNGSGTDTGGAAVDPEFPPLSCTDNSLQNSSQFINFLDHYMQAGVAPENRIFVLYVGNETFPNGTTAACAYSNVLVRGRRYNVIIMTNGCNNSANDSIFAHEIGHILFGTVPNQTNVDPTTILDSRGPNPHSYRSGNVMFPAPGNNTELLSTQLEKAKKSRLFTT